MKAAHTARISSLHTRWKNTITPTAEEEQKEEERELIFSKMPLKVKVFAVLCQCVVVSNLQFCEIRYETWLIVWWWLIYHASASCGRDGASDG